MITTIKRSCTNCFKVKPMTEFAWKYKPKGLRAARCRKCRSDIEARRQLEEKLTNRPNEYVDCDTCDHIFNKKLFKGVCPRCNTKGVN